MDLSLQFSISGLEDKFATELASDVGAVIDEIWKADPSLDFRRMHRVIITADMHSAMEELAAQRPSDNPILYTREEYAVAVAKVITLPCDDDYEFVLVIDAGIASVLTTADNEDFDRDQFLTVVHLLHHELCHIHDNNKKMDILKGIALVQCYTGKKMMTGPVAEGCWSEYLANRLSSLSANDNSISMMAENFREAIKRTKESIDQEIISYRYHADLDHLLSLFRRHGAFLPKTAAYMLGYVDGLKKTLEELSPQTAEALSGSYFEPVWNEMHRVLGEMFSVYPSGWSGLSIFKKLNIE